MEWLLKLGVFLIASVAAGAAIARESRDAPTPSITVGVHYQGTCLGKCPCFDATVNRDGLVEVRSCQSSPKVANVTRFRVSRAEADAFERVLRPLKSGPRLRGDCRTRPKPLDEQTAEWVVTWASAKRASLRACWDNTVSTSIEQALSTIGASPNSGRPIRH